MKIPVTPGHPYAVTAPTSCTVSAVAGDGTLIPLLAVASPGQYVLVAPCAGLDIDNSHVLVTPMRGRTGLAPRAGPILEWSYEHLFQTLDAGNENLNAHGFGMVADASGTLRSVSVRSRNANLLHKNPLWLKIWLLENGSFIHYGVSSNSVTQAASAYGTWKLPGIPLKQGEHILFTFHTEQYRDTSAWGNYATGGMRVQAMTPADHVGCVRSPVNPPVMYNYLPDYRLALSAVSGIRAGGSPLAFAGTVSEHAGNQTIHITSAEREAWNAKAEASALAAKLNSATFTAHKNDEEAHLSPEEHASVQELVRNKNALLALLNPPQAQTA